MIVLCPACVLEDPYDQTQDMAMENLQKCGVKEEINSSGGVSLQYGFGRPFESSEFLGTSSDPLDLPMEYGIQGGHHVDISLRFTGSLDPDLVDITINLIIDNPFNDLFYGIHNTQGWFLLFPQEEEVFGCYFHQARIFLFDLEGLPVEPLGVSMLNGLGADLYIKLSTETADHEWSARGNLRNAVNDQ
jgi:hypothetical protein